MPAKKDITKLLEELNHQQLKTINEYFGLPNRKSKKDNVRQILKSASDLQDIIHSGGPLSRNEWNDILESWGGRREKTFEGIIEEFRFMMLPVFYEFKADDSVSELRETKAFLSAIKKYLGDRAEHLIEKMLNSTHGKVQVYTLMKRLEKMKVGAFSKARLPSASLGNSFDDSSYQVFSTTILGDEIKQFSIQNILATADNADELDIAVAYYSFAALDELLSATRAKKIRLVVNGLGGIRLKEQVEELSELSKNLSNSKDIEVRLAFSEGIFHPKLYLIKGKEVMAWIGSANASDSALKTGRNEELMVKINAASPLVSYFEEVWIKAKGLLIEEPEIGSLEGFFRTGVLFFKSHSTLGTTYNPIRPLIQAMTKEERESIGSVPIQYSELAGGIGPFNILLALDEIVPGWQFDWAQDNADDNEENLELLERQDAAEYGTSDAGGGKRKVVQLGPVSVETSLGYWVPNAKYDDLMNNISEAGEKRMMYFSRLADLVKQYKDQIREACRVYLRSAKKVINDKANDVLIREENIAKSAFSISEFDKFLSRFLQTLSNEKSLKRLSLPFVDSPFPEIWSDELAYSSFRQSFFDYLDFVSDASKGTKNSVARKLLQALEDKRLDISPGEIEKSLEEYVEKYGWPENNWNKD